MKIEVRLYATLRKHAPPGTEAGVLEADLPGQSTVTDVLGQLGIDPQEVHMIMLNGVSAELQAELKAGDRLGLFPPVGGG